MCSALQQTQAHVVGLHTAATAHTESPATTEKPLSTVVPNMPGPQNTTPLCDEKKHFRQLHFPTSTKAKLGLFIDLLIVVCVILLIALVEFGVFPHHQSGFYCNDPKISFKFQGDTISMGILLSTVYFCPLILISIVEFRESKRSLSVTLRRLWYWYKEFLLGMTVNLVITEFAKVIVGEPRPHFLDTCSPNTAINCTPDKYIPYYECTNTHIKQWFVSDSSKSFPSGHSSLSVFSAAFCVWYLQRCMSQLSCKLVKPLVQTLLLAACAMCSLSRITDHRHHWWDVLAGAVLGFLCAIYTVTVFCRNFRCPPLSQPRPSHSTCTLLTDTTNKHATSVVL